MIMQIMLCMVIHFNTSHVNVNPVAVVTPMLPCIISIHLMLMLIGVCNCE